MTLQTFDEYVKIQAKKKRNQRQYNSKSYKDRSTIVINKKNKELLDKMYNAETKKRKITKREFTNNIIEDYAKNNYSELLGDKHDEE